MALSECKAKKPVCITEFEVFGQSIPAKLVVDKLTSPDDKKDICTSKDSFCMSNPTFKLLNDRLTALALQAVKAADKTVEPEPAARLDHLPKVVQNLVRSPSERTIQRTLDKINDLLELLPPPWNDPSKLKPEYVIPTLHSEGRALEALSFVRMIAIAMGKLSDAGLSSDLASHFISKVIESDQLILAATNNQQGSYLAYLLIKFAANNSQLFKYDKSLWEFKAASIQFELGFADTPQKVKDNIAGLAKLAEDAAKSGAKFIVTPEIAVQGYADVDFANPRDQGQNKDYESFFFQSGVRRMWCHDSQLAGCSGGKEVLEVSEGTPPIKFVDATSVALELDAKELTVFAEIAKRYETYISVGYIEKEGTGKAQRLYNSLNVYSPDGSLVYHYRKTNLWKPVDKYLYTQSTLSQKPYFDTPYGKFSAAICFDGNFIFPQLAPFNVDTLLYSVAWVSGGPNSPSPNHQMIASKVAKDPMNVIGANWVWPDDPKTRETILGANAELWGSGLSYAMDNAGGIRGMIAGSNAGAEILFSTIPYKPQFNLETLFKILSYLFPSWIS